MDRDAVIGGCQAAGPGDLCLFQDIGTRVTGREAQLLLEGRTMLKAATQKRSGAASEEVRLFCLTQRTCTSITTADFRCSCVLATPAALHSHQLPHATLLS
jgi:hypothetical protein